MEHAENKVVTRTSAPSLVYEPQEEVACPMCGEHSNAIVFRARDRLFGRPGTYRIVSCTACELRYLSPRPTLEALGAHYPNEYFVHQDTERLSPRMRRMAERYVDNRWSTSLQRLERVTGKLRADTRIVDVGCGLNEYLVALRRMRGIEGVGVDFKPEAAAYIRDKLNMPVHEGTLHQAGFASGSFDIVAMNEYLEHEPNPRDVLVEARRITVPRGYLTLEVPYAEGPAARLFGSRWSQLDVPRHLIHFTHKTLAEMLRRTGWELVHTETFSMPFMIGLSVLELFGYRNLCRFTALDRALASVAALPFMAFPSRFDEFRYGVARAV